MDTAEISETERCAIVLNRIFNDASVRLQAHPTTYLSRPALRIINASMPLASPFADLTGDARRKLASAFIKAGVHTGESLTLADKSNGPALLLDVYTPPADMYWVVQRGLLNPWSAHLLRPDADYLETIAPVLSDALRVRFA